MRVLLPPVDLAGMTPRMGAVPALGEHNESVLAELGYSAAHIDTLRAHHVI